MKAAKEAKKYAKTLINIIGMEDMPKALAELTVIENLMQKSKEFKSFLVNPVFSQSDKEKALRQIAQKAGLSEKVVRFLLHLSELRVVIALSEVIKRATAIYLEKKRQARALVITPVEIGKTYEERLKASLKKLVQKDVELEYVFDPTLLGGILIKVGSTMYDSSIKGQLRLLKEELIKG